MYEPPTLFPDLQQYGHPQHDDRAHKHIQQRLLELAEAGKLCLTDVLCQPKHISDHAGGILLGVALESGVDPGTGTSTLTPKRSLEPVADVFANYRVKLELINDALEPDHRMHGMVRIKVGHERRGHLSSKGGAVLKGQQTLWRDKFKEVPVDDNNQCELSIPDAWLCLLQKGEHVAYGKRKDTQQRRWLVREVVERPQLKARPKPKPRVRAAEATV